MEFNNLHVLVTSHYRKLLCCVFHKSRNYLARTRILKDRSHGCVRPKGYYLFSAVFSHGVCKCSQTTHQ